MEILLGILIQWLALNANIDIENPPTVQVVEAKVLQADYGAPVYALYSHQDSAIYLSDTVDLSTIQGASVLLHELIHHYQNVSGAMDGYSCVRESEQLAYDVQRQYLIANKAKVLPELNEFNTLMMSMCANYFE